MKIKNKGQATMFQSKWLEVMTKTSPQAIFSIYIPIIAAMLAYGFFSFHISWYLVITYYFSGMIFWTFFEYLMHRFVFHHHSDNPKVQKFMYTAHGVHHEFPRDKERLFMPPVPSLLLASIIFTSFYFLLNFNTFVFFPGFITGYLAYGSMHYAIHAMAPPFKFMKSWWRYHHLHHYKSPDKGFGVSSPMWDHVFGSVPQHEGRFNNPEEK